MTMTTGNFIHTAAIQKEWEYVSLFDGQVHGILQCLYWIIPWATGAGSVLPNKARKEKLIANCHHAH